MTAKAAIDDRVAKKYEEGKTVSIISTDLSLAFDSVDHPTLLNKMKFYGIENKENEFFASYLQGRTQFIELETSKSTVRNANDCSVIQGSKLSSLLYSIYTNESCEIKRLMEDKEALEKILGKEPPELSEVDHDAYSYVDDTYNCIATKEHEKLEDYINTYFKVLKEFYSANKLKLNAEKTTLLIASQPRNREKNKNTKLYNDPGEKDVVPTNQIKVLGFITNERGRNDTQAGKIIAEMSNTINKGIKCKKYMSKRARKSLMSSHVLSKV